MTELNKTQISLLLGQPGTGKSTELIKRATDDVIKGRQVWLLTPTHGARESLRANIDKQIAQESSKTRIEALKSLRYSIGVKYGYNLQNTIYVDEASMIATSDFLGILYQTQHVDDAKIVLVGDLKQVPIPGSENGAVSVLESIISNGIDEPIWDWTSSAYANVSFDKIQAPASWFMKSPIKFEALVENYRLGAEGFTGYDESYIQAVIDRTIDRHTDSGQHADYTDVLATALDINALIISPTHRRGELADEMIAKYYKENSREHFPFVRDQSVKRKVYINPDNADVESVKQAFPFIKELTPDVNRSNLKLSAYVSTNTAQGSNVTNTLYWLGDEKLPTNERTSHYSMNNFYTGISRSTNMAQLVGRKESFEKMTKIRPQSGQQRMGHLRADMAITKLFNTLQKLESKMDFEEVYSLYENIFNESKLPENVERQLADYNITDEIYSPDRLRLAFKAYDDELAIKKGFRPMYKALFYDMHIKSVNALNGTKKAGRGKTQQFVAGLSDEELEQVKADMDLSRAKFKSKWHMDKRSVASAL